MGLERPEAKHVRARIKRALRVGGIDIAPERLVLALVNEALALILEDRATSAGIVSAAAGAYGSLDSDQLDRLADVIEHRFEAEPGVVSIQIED